MKYLILEVRDRVAHVTLNRGSSNALHEEMIGELKDALEIVQKDEKIGGIVLYGRDGFFSSGLDLIALYEYDEEKIKAFWYQFLDLVKTFVSFNKPAIAAISGHSPAGGCVLALCCDYRLMVDGEFVIGLNEVPVGIIVPDSIFDLYSFWIGKAKAYRFLLAGELMTPQQALQEGLIDEVVPANQLRTLADRQMKKYLNFNWNTWQQSKYHMRKELLAKFEQDASEMVDEILKQWWDPATRAILKTIINNLQGKKN